VAHSGFFSPIQESFSATVSAVMDEVPHLVLDCGEYLLKAGL